MLFQCSWHMCSSGMHLQLPLVLDWRAPSSDTHSAAEEIPLCLWNNHCEQGGEKLAGKGLRFRIFPSRCSGDKRTAEKNHVLSFPPHPCFCTDEEQSDISWSKFYSLSFNRSKKIIALSWASLLEWWEGHSLLREDPEDCSETSFDCTDWTRRFSLLKHLWAVISIPVAPETEASLSTFFLPILRGLMHINLKGWTHFSQLPLDALWV